MSCKSSVGNADSERDTVFSISEDMMVDKGGVKAYFFRAGMLF